MCSTIMRWDYNAGYIQTSCSTKKVFLEFEYKYALYVDKFDTR